MPKSQAVTYARNGAPEEVVEISELEVASPGAGEVLIQMLAAPINPADLNLIQGNYAVSRSLPAVAGIEGVAQVMALGRDVADLEIGAHVLVPSDFGSWRERGVAAHAELIRVPGDLAVEQAAMLRVNPPTAWRMLHDFVELREGDWILQNVANSGVGRAVIAIAREKGWRTVNVVRRAELVDELREEGADVVLLDGEHLAEQIAEATEGAAKLALNAVGGESALRLANALAPGGTLVTYGAMARQPLRIPNGLLIFKDLRWRGFWVTHWFKTAAPAAVDEMFQQLLPLVERGALRGKVEKSYPITEAKEAIRHAQQNKRTGKILFRFD